MSSGTAPGRISRDKSAYTRMDRRIESMIEGRQLEQLLDFAKDHALRIGDMLGNYRLVLAQWEESNPELLKKLLTMTWDRLDDETRRRFVHLMTGMIYRVSESIVRQSGVPTGEPAVTRFDFQSDEIDLDRTVDGLTGRRSVSYEDIYVLARKKHKKAAVIMIDASGSMHGANLSIAAIAAASLAMNLNFRDEYGIILFSEQYHLFKRVDQPKHLDEVIRGILDILPAGRTNIGVGLAAGLQELQRANVAEKIGIILTDGWQNIGADPLKTAARFPRLHVINLPGGSAELSKKIARSGRGCFIPLNDMLDVSKAIVACLLQ